MAFLVGYGRVRRRRPRTFRARATLADFNDLEIGSCYRLSRDLIQQIITGYSTSRFVSVTRRSHAISPETQVLVALRYLAKGGHFSEVGRIHGISKSSVSRAVLYVCSYLCSMAHREIKFPELPAELARLAIDFNGVAHVPKVIGCIDGTHIGILAPSAEEHAFVNRKGGHSINVMLTCDHDLIIRDVEARWPGSCHDSFILNMSILYDQFEAGLYGNYWLLGDSGYPSKPWLLTPMLRPATAAEEQYNAAHKRTRSIIERCNGVLKSRFRCLHKSGGVLQTKPSTSSKIIMACCVLHNRCIRARLAPPADILSNCSDDDDDHDDDDNDDTNRNSNPDGFQTRRKLINNHFT